MEKKVIAALIDTNVVLDYAEKREGFFETAEKVFLQMWQGAFVGFVSASAVTDIYFFLKKRYKDTKIAMSLLKMLLDALDVLAVSRETIDTAIESDMADFEDAVQAIAAQDFGIGIVVTRDKAGFRNSGLRGYSPEEFLETLKT
jgi:predicted nucleic-acid-binding protein